MNRLDAIIEKYFEEGLLTVTGARDKYGYHILTLPAHHLVSMETMDARYFVAVLHRYILWEHLVFQNNPGIALLLNLKNTRKSVIQIVADALTILESKKKTIIQMVYIVKPDTRVKSHLLKKLLGIKPPQQFDNPRQFQIHMVKTLELLRDYIEPGQLTRDYGGMLYHDHQAWLNFYKKSEPCLNSAKKLMVQLPGIKEKVELWEEYASPDHSVEELHQILDDIPHQFETILKECNFESVLEDCKQLLHVLQTTDNDIEDINNALISPVIVTIRKYYQDLTQYQQDLVLLYKTSETKITATFHLLQCHEKANKIVKNIKEEYESQLPEHPAVGLSLSQAELYRNHFTASIYQPCKNLISDATDILEDLKKVATESELRTSITSQLTATIEPFTLKLHTVYESYIQLHIFHTLLTKFGKWYKKVLKFLPEYLRKQTESETQDKIINMPDEWNYTVDTFLSKHPPPREEHIVKIDHDMPSLLPKQLKQQAHCLAIRTKLLQRLLTSRCLPVKLINAAMTWKNELEPPAKPLKLKPQIKISSPSSASSNEEEEKQRFKPRSPRRKSVQNVAENMKQDLSVKQESKIKPDLKIESPKPEEESKERFIRLTFTPKDFEEEGTARQRFSFSDVATGSESGIEVVDPEDPYDTIIDKIREVSNSPLSSDLKLKYVTNLLRCSLRDAELRKPRYVKNTRRTRRQSRLKSAYGKSAGNLLDMERPDVQEPKMSSFHSLRNLSEIGVDNEMHSSRSELFLPSLRPTSSLHDLYSEVERSPGAIGLPRATGMSKWYHGYERKDNQKPLEEDCYSERLQQDIRRLQRCHSERMEEENILEQEKQRLDEIVMEAELYKQDRVENSLRRSHDMLQNEEMRLNEDINNGPTWIRNYEDMATGHPVEYQHPKSDLGYDSFSSPRTFSRTTGSSRPILSSKTSYEDPDYQYETKQKHLRNSGHALPTPSQHTSKASQALGSILPRFNSTEEIDEFCVKLKSKSLHNKTVAEVHQSDFCHNQSSTSQYKGDDNLLDDTDFY